MTNAQVTVKGFIAGIEKVVKTKTGSEKKPVTRVFGVEEAENWKEATYAKVVANYLSWADFEDWAENGKTFINQKIKVILAGREVPTYVHAQYASAIKATLAEIILQKKKEEKIKNERMRTALKARQQHEAEQAAREKKAGAVSEKGKETSGSDSLLRRILSAKKVNMEPSGFAFHLDGVVSAPQEALVLNAGARFLLGGAFYLIDDRSGKKIIKSFVGGRVKQEKVPEAEKALPENLDKVWVTLETKKGNKTFLVSVLPDGFSPDDQQVKDRFQTGEMFANRKGEGFPVWRRMKESSEVVGVCRLATSEEKKEKKAKKASPVSPKKKPVKVADAYATPLEIALKSAGLKSSEISA